MFCQAGFGLLRFFFLFIQLFLESRLLASAAFSFAAAACALNSSSLATVGAYKKPRFLKNLVFLAICEMEFSRCNYSIAAGFVLAWTPIGRLHLRDI